MIKKKSLDIILIENCIEINVDSHAIIRNNTERSLVPFAWRIPCIRQW
jgi:hypothetical protein